MSNIIAKRLILKGRVQGVGCRFQVQEVVESVGHVNGWVKNLDNGDVEVVLKGPDWRVKDIEKIFHEGMVSPVRIDSIQTEDLPDFFPAKGFSIIR